MSFRRFLSDNARFLGAGALLSFGSSFGQTFFISVFAGVLMDELSLSHGAWGGIYALGTTLSAAVMVWAGTLADRYRVRQIAWVVIPCLALACLAMAAVPNGVLLVPVIFALRLFGQGMMSHLAITAMARWFVAARGRALSLSALGFAFGQAVLPLAIVVMMSLMDWRWIWVIAAAVLVLGVPVLARLLRTERTPQSTAEDSETLGMEGRHWTRRQAMRHWLFWASVPMVLGPSAFGTALFFQKVHLAEVKGWDLAHFVALFPVFTIVGFAMTFLSGWAIDRIGIARVASVFLLPWALGFAVMSQAETLAGAAVAMMIIGAGTGFQATVPAAYWAGFYGTRHIGAIKSLAMAIMVLGSALGPGISGALIDLGIDFPQQMVAIAVYFLAAAALIAWGIQRAVPLLDASAPAAA